MAQTKINGNLQLSVPESSLLLKSGGQMSGALDFNSEVSIASSTTTNIGALGSNSVLITGSVTITAFDSVAAGIHRKVRFSSSLVLTHNATTLILPGAANITTSANDIAEFRSEGSGNWRCLKYTKADGTSVAGTSSGDSFIIQDIQLLGLLIADLYGDRINMVDGISDPFLDTTDINTTISSGYSFVAGLISPSTSSPFYGGTPLSGGDAASHAASLAFDQNTSTYWASSQTTTGVAGVSYIGLNLGSSKLVTSFTITTYSTAANNMSAVKAQYSPDGTTWTSANSGSNVTTSTVINTTTNYTFTSTVAGQYWRLLAVNNPGSGSWNLPELVFYVQTSSFLLQSNAFTSDLFNPSVVRLVVQVSSTAVTHTINTDLLGYVSRDGGTTFTQVTLSLLQTMADGSIIYSGTASVSGQPTGSSMVYKLTMPVVTKSIPIAGVALQWRP